MKFLEKNLVSAFVLVLFSGVASASTPITIVCKETQIAERTEQVIEHKISFDTDNGYKNLEFNVYGSKLTVGATFFMKDDGVTCGHRLDNICVSSKESNFCTTTAKAILFSTGKYSQPGDKSFIECSIANNKLFVCPKEEN